MVLKEGFEFLFDCGFSKPLASCDLTDRSDIMACVILHFTHYRIRAELDQLNFGISRISTALNDHTAKPRLWEILLNIWHVYTVYL